MVYEAGAGGVCKPYGMLNNLYLSVGRPSDPGRLKPMYLTAMDGGCSFQDRWDDQLQTQCSFASSEGSAWYAKFG